MHDSMFCRVFEPLHALKAHVKGFCGFTCALSACKGCFHMILSSSPKFILYFISKYLNPFLVIVLVNFN